MKWVIRILAILILAALAAGAAAFVLLPKEASVTREILVERPARSVLTWLATTPEGDAFGAGTETVKSTTADRIETEISLPNKGKAMGVYTLEPQPNGVKVTLTASRAYGADIMARLAKAQGSDGLTAAIDEGVAQLQAELEALPTFDFSGLKYEIMDVAAKPFIYLEASTKQEAANIKNAMRQSLPLVRTAIETNKLTVTGAPIAVETNWADGRYEFQAGLPYMGEAGELFGVKAGQTPEGRAIMVTYEGPEENVIPVYDQIESLIAASRLTRSGPSYEVYLDDPTQETGAAKREIYHIITGDDAALSRVPQS